jgi:hypothetical protein
MKMVPTTRREVHNSIFITTNVRCQKTLSKILNETITNLIERFAEDIDFDSAEINRFNLSIFCGESFVCGE